MLLFPLKASSCISVCLPSGYRYITCQIQNCSDKTMTVQFAGGTDRDSLTVQDDYIFLQVMPHSGETAHFKIQKYNFRQYNSTVIEKSVEKPVPGYE